MRHLQVNVVQVHTRGVRDGLLLTMVQQSPTPPAVPAEDRRAAVEEFAKNCGVDLPHARQVARIAGSLWQQLAAPLGLKTGRPRADRVGRADCERRLPHQLRRPSQAQLPFDREQRAARLRAPAAADPGERRPLPSRHPAEEAAREFRRAVARRPDSACVALAAILRLALALDRTHQQNVAEVRARVRDDVVRIVVQSQGDADVDLWAAERKVDLFEKVFGRKVRFSELESDSRAHGKRRSRSIRSAGGGRSQP